MADLNGYHIYVVNLILNICHSTYYNTGADPEGGRGGNYWIGTNCSWYSVNECVNW